MLNVRRVRALDCAHRRRLLRDGADGSRQRVRPVPRGLGVTALFSLKKATRAHRVCFYKLGRRARGAFTDRRASVSVACLVCSYTLDVYLLR